MPGPIELLFTNYSSVTLDQSSSYTNYGVEKGVGGISTLPSDTLNAGGGGTSMSMDENLISNLAGGYCWINCGWKNPNDNYHFGVKIFMPLQVMHMGDRPYYQVAYSTDGSGPDWTTPVSDPASPYTFSPKIDFLISCVPTSSHTSLSVAVSISDAT